MVVMTHPQIGNYGIASSGDESVRPWVSGLIVRELAAQPHHWESRARLEDFLTQWDVPGLQGIDTRALVRRLRDSGTQRGVVQQSRPGGFSAQDLDGLREAARNAPSVSQLELVSDVSDVLPRSALRTQHSALGDEVALVDCGSK